LLNSTQSITYQHISLPSMKHLRKPMTLSRMQAVTVRGGWAYDISFEISNLNDTSLFDISQDRNTGSLQLVKPVTGPDQFSVHVEMNVESSYSYFPYQKQTTRYLAIINIFISAYNF